MKNHKYNLQLHPFLLPFFFFGVFIKALLMVFKLSIFNKKDQSNKDILIMFCDSTLDPIPSRTVKSFPFIEEEEYIL